MKAALLILVTAGVAAAAWFGLRPDHAPPAAAVDPASLHPGTMAVKTDPAAVFQQALWRRPSAEDKILHAVRREWITEPTRGVAHWQWFLAIEPGPALRKWLREENSFAVHPAAAAPVSAAPGWFPQDFSDCEILTGGTTGHLVLLFTRDGKTLYATDTGGGLTPGAPGSATAAPPPPAATGRLPLTPPPASTSK